MKYSFGVNLHNIRVTRISGFTVCGSGLWLLLISACVVYRLLYCYDSGVAMADLIWVGRGMGTCHTPKFQSWGKIGYMT